MQLWIIDLVIAILILGVTYALSSEGAWGAALMFFNVLFSGLIAFNFYETLARILVDSAPAMAGWADLICLMGLFLISLIIFRITTDSLAPGMVRFPKPLYHLGRLGFGFATATMLLGILLCAFATAPIHRRMFGSVRYNSKPPYGQGVDRMWLAFVQYSTENSFARYNRENVPQMFDPTGSWLIDHQNARPYLWSTSTDRVPEPEEGATAAPAPAPEG